MADIKVDAKVNIVPAKRRATYTVPLTDKKNDLLKANVNVGNLSFETRGSYAISIDKSLAQVDAFIALLGAVRAELVEQGITE